MMRLRQVNLPEIAIFYSELNPWSESRLALIDVGAIYGRSDWRSRGQYDHVANWVE